VIPSIQSFSYDSDLKTEEKEYPDVSPISF